MKNLLNDKQSDETKKDNILRFFGQSDDDRKKFENTVIEGALLEMLVNFVDDGGDELGINRLLTYGG